MVWREVEPFAFRKKVPRSGGSCDWADALLKYLAPRKTPPPHGRHMWVTTTASNAPATGAYSYDMTNYDQYMAVSRVHKGAEGI